MVEDRGLGFLLGSQTRVGGDCLHQGGLKRFLLLEETIEQGKIRRRDRRAVRVLAQQIRRVHRDENRGVGILLSDEPDGAVAHEEVVREINLLESRILAYQLEGKRAGLSLPRNHWCRVASGPAIVVPRNSRQHPGPWFWRQKSVVSPALGKRARQSGMVRMGHQPPARFCLQPQHNFPRAHGPARALYVPRASTPIALIGSYGNLLRLRYRP